MNDLSRRELEAEIEMLQGEVGRLKENNDVLGKVVHDLRGALQSIADGIGDQKTAENALHRLTSRGIADLDVDPSKVGIKGRIEELEAERDRLCRRLDQIKGMIDAAPPTIDAGAARLVRDIHDACVAELGDGGPDDA